MKLCQLVIVQDLSKLKLYDSPLMHYLAVRGVDTQAEGFRGPMHHTGILADALWIERLLALEIAIPSEPWPELGLLGKADIQFVPECIREFRLSHLSQLAKGKKDNSIHHSPSNIYWSEDKETIYYIGKPIELRKIGPICNTLTLELKDLISQLSFEIELPTIQLDKVIDSTAWTQQFRRADFNFTEHPVNKELDVDYSFLLERARTAVGEFQMFEQTVGLFGRESGI